MKSLRDRIGIGLIRVGERFLSGHVSGRMVQTMKDGTTHRHHCLQPQLQFPGEQGRYPSVTRVEVIGKGGRLLTKTVESSPVVTHLQDDARTLKIFIQEKQP